MSKEKLEELHKEIWKEERYNDGRPYLESKRMITIEEWKLVKSTIAEVPLVCQMINTRFGFGIGIDVWELPVAPGAPPLHVIRVADEQLPWPEAAQRLKDMERVDRWNMAWDAFSPLTHSEENIRLCGVSGIEKPREKVYYDY